MTTETALAPALKRSQGHRVIRFVEGHCVHTASEWIGKPIRLLPWQKQLIMELFEVRDDGLRRYRWAYVSTAKKNGKSELAAALALYFLLGDDEAAPLVVCAAASDEQADLVFGAAKTMCEMSPTLSQITERYDREILVPSSPGARLKRVAAVAGTNDGQNISAAFLDELHEWTGPRGQATWDVLTNGVGARRQPMIFQTTTAGYDLEGTVCGRQYQHAKAVERGEVQDSTYYSRIYEAPEGADYRDPAVWQAANPSYGVLVHEPFFLDQLGKKQEAVFRRYFCNQWTKTETAWLPIGAWEACEDASLALEPSLPVRVGVDLSLRRDATAVVAAQRQGERVVLRAKTWVNPYPAGHSLHDAWIVPRNEVRAYCRELFERFPEPAASIDGDLRAGPEFLVDPWSAREFIDDLDEEGLAVAEFPQTDQRMCPAAATFFELIQTGRIAHDGDQVLAQHIANVTVDQRRRGWRMSKPKGSPRHIDAAIAAAIAASRALEQAPQTERSCYEDQDGLDWI